MSALVDRLVARILGLDVRLLACQARLSARTDPEALHDLRTTVRRLRSLLRPLRGLPGVEQLEAAASHVGDLTTPLRDREVLAAYLLQHDQPEAAQRRMVLLIDGFIVSSALLEAARLQPAVLDYCVFAHCSGEHGHAQLLRHLGGRPLLQLGMRLGEGSGAALALPLVQAAAGFLCEMATFESAAVSNRAAGA